MRATIVALAALVMVGCSPEGAVVGVEPDSGVEAPADVPAIAGPGPISGGPPGGTSDGGGTDDGSADGSSSDAIEDGAGGADGATGGDSAGAIDGGIANPGIGGPGGPIRGAIPCVTDFVWSTLLAGSSEATPIPSDLLPADLRAGSLEMNFNGGYGFDGIQNDPPKAAAIITLRNGAGGLLEQVHLNRRFVPAQLDDAGCSLVKPHHECWLEAPYDLVDGGLHAALPALSGGSNEGFDASGQRVSVEGSVHMTLSGLEAPPKDNAHETFVARWVAPRGLETARVFLQARFESALGAEGIKTVLVPLFAMRWPATGPWRLAPGLRIAELTDTTVAVTGTVEQALDDTCNADMDAPCFLVPGPLDVTPNQLAWTLSNPGAKPARISSIFVGLPAETAITGVDAGGAVVAGPQGAGPMFIDTWVGSEGAREVPPGGELLLAVHVAGQGVAAPDVRLLAATDAGCLFAPTE